MLVKLGTKENVSEYVGAFAGGNEEFELQTLKPFLLLVPCFLGFKQFYNAALSLWMSTLNFEGAHSEHRCL